MLGIPDVVIFGIKSGLKLAKQGRQAYIEETISKAMVLPLPNFNPKFKKADAILYFSGRGSSHLVDNEILKELINRLNTDGGDLSEHESEILIKAFNDFTLLDSLKDDRIPKADLEKSGLSVDAFRSLVTVRQFANNNQFPSALQRVLGSLIEVGVDAFAQFPGIVDTKSAAGRALSGFLTAIDGIEFKSENIEVLARSLFITAAETIRENADLLGADENTEKLIEKISGGLVRDLVSRIDKQGISLIERERVERWGQLVLRSILGNLGETVISNPKSLGIDDPAKQALLSSVGTSILSVILEEDKVNLRTLFNRQSLDQVVKASLNTVAEFPELLGADGNGIRTIISHVALGLSENTHVLSKDMLPETLRLIIEKTAQNAESLFPAGIDDPGKHLLIKASVQFLNQFASLPEPGQTWRPAFSKTLLTGLLDVVLEETVQNPEWVADLDIKDKTILGEATRIALDVLQDVPANRLNLETGANILRAIIQAVAMRRDFLKEIEIAGEKRPALAAALKALTDSILSEGLDPKVLWAMARGEVVSALISTALEVLAKLGINETTITQVLAVVEKAKQAIIDGKRWILEEVLDELKKLI